MFALAPNVQKTPSFLFLQEMGGCYLLAILTPSGPRKEVD
jgi:hypothetical protein